MERPWQAVADLLRPMMMMTLAMLDSPVAVDLLRPMTTMMSAMSGLPVVADLLPPTTMMMSGICLWLNSRNRYNSARLLNSWLTSGAGL